ncbi:FmdE family protein [Methanobacterium sp.]|uniref:FmdE family protein n=1 Tax=Methanobacterium sp. TaxID=2164 RepID=UPI0025E7C2F3|nr:FmdE family protein [Methanobacterium sp.]MBI5460135.1 TraR/DksA C4-type zinc finger protein [Methanobacterium sp.]
MEDAKECEIIPFSDVIKFHGHSCPGISIGYRAAEIAICELLSARAEDEELVAIVENDSCSVDAIQVVTGCTMGKGNLIFKDHGKHVYTFMNRETGEALRISLKKDMTEMDPEFAIARKKAFSPSATPEDMSRFIELRNKATADILEGPAEDLFKVESVEMEFPEEARIFKSIYCAKCGEPVAEHRSRVENGEIVCIPCFNNYSRR